MGDNMYALSANSGIPSILEPGEVSTLTPGALEQSNVDLADEFTKMIMAQRGFQANARVISTSDELLQELVNLKM
jgi:flagellar hook protein FlgE